MRATFVRIVEILAALLLLGAAATPTLGQSAYRFDKVAQGPTGQAIPQANIAVCTQPANISTTPCSTLATLYPDSNATNYTISAIRCSAYVLTITTSVNNTIPINQWVVISGVANASFDGTYQVASSTLTGTFTVSAPCTNGSSSGGTVSAANPTFSDGFGNYFWYATAGAYTVQVYGNAITTEYFPDQFVGQYSVLSINYARECKGVGRCRVGRSGIKSDTGCTFCTWPEAPDCDHRSS